jgi:hypothetical protein
MPGELVKEPANRRRRSMRRVPFLIVVFLVFVVSPKFIFGDESILLKAEIIGNKDGQILVDKNYKKGFQFILKAGSKKMSVFEGNNMWNYSNRSFTAEDKTDRKSKYKIYRFQTSWLKNFPVTHEIEPNDFIIEEINFCDGTWTIDPPLPKGKDHHLLLRGHYDVDDPKNDSVIMRHLKMGIIKAPWFGHLDTNTIEMTIKKNAVNFFKAVDVPLDGFITR